MTEDMDSNRSPTSSGSPTRSSSSDAEDESLSSSVDSAAWDQDLSEKNSTLGRHGTIWQRLGRAAESISILEVAAFDEGSNTAYLLGNTSTGKVNTDSPRNLVVARLVGGTRPALGPSLQAILETSGWIITQQTLPFYKPAPGSVVLVLDELSQHVLKHVDEKQWDGIKTLVTSGSPLLWVTKGAQHPVTDPDNALVHGLFRVAHQEDRTTSLTTLDVQSGTSRATEWAVNRVLELLATAGSATTETQYMERDGVLHIQRNIPDAAANELKRAEVEGYEPVVKPLHANEAQVMLRAERIGTLQSLTWCETNVDEVPVAPGWVEVQVMAGGVNFKDVAITMGIVADNEYAMGLECGGVVRRVGQGVSKFKVGDRVCVLKPGTYSNRVLTEAGRCHLIPDSMNFVDAATIPSVYLCSLYGLYHLANLREGQASREPLPR